MPKVTKILGNNKARAWESPGFAHKKRLCQHFDTTSKNFGNHGNSRFILNFAMKNLSDLKI